MKVILTHNYADFDAVASMLGAYKLNPEAVPVLPVKQNRNVQKFMILYRSGLPFITVDDLRPQHVTGIILTDTDHVHGIYNLESGLPTHIIDHHQDNRPLEPYETRESAAVGATTTLLVEKIQCQHISLTSLEATLLALGIHEDTGSLTYGVTTSRDARAAAWLMEQNAALDTIRRFLAPPLTDKQQVVFEQLLQNAETRTIHGYPVTVSAMQSESYVEGINSVAHRLRDMLDSTALFLLVGMSDIVQLVARSEVEAIDAGAVAQLFDGGGHARAAAAPIRDYTLAEAVQRIWDYLDTSVQPLTRVSELMSYGVQTISADRSLRDIIPRMRRIGHEGFPVVDGQHVIGLLIRRDVDRALEHGLGGLSVRDVMIEGNVTLQPDDSVSRLEQLMVDSGWGQIPVVDGGRIVGIVTRTDLINHWANKHPTVKQTESWLPPDQLQNVLGSAVATLIRRIVRRAQEDHTTLYLVGGVVRDLLLHRPNYDVDFVVEGDAITFARSLCDTFGGKMHSHRPFGTAKWLLDESVAEALNLRLDKLPTHLDFATARNEFYEHPTALPTVYTSSIKLDLQRRDFTINTLAIQLSPRTAMWRILDFYGGMKDLNDRLIRVLHSLSFVDDPTRILRAVRFSERLRFSIEARTSELISTALPQLRRITGKRVRNELSLLLHEQEPERGLRKLQALGALKSIHPDFRIDDRIVDSFYAARTRKPPWETDDTALVDIYWHLIVACLSPVEAEAAAERLMFPRGSIQSLIDAAWLAKHEKSLLESRLRPSEIVQKLSKLSETALLAAWLFMSHPIVRDRIEQYMLTWRHVAPQADGHTLKAMGLEPGPHFRVILDQLRTAWLDGDITRPAEEKRLLARLIAEVDKQDD